MLALYRSGRQGDALRVCDELRSILLDELGIDPGHDVTWLEHAILEQDPALDYPVPPERAESDEPVQVTVPAYQARVPSGPNEGPLVGRDRECEQLRDWWDAACRGDLQLLLVDGEPGIGKTRLVAELARSLESEGVLVLWGRCDEDRVAPFQPFAESLGRYFQSVSVDQITRLPEWQITELARLVLSLREHVPILEEEPGDPETERYRFFGAITQTLERPVRAWEGPPGRRRPALGRPAHAAPVAPRAAQRRRDQHGDHRDVHRLRGPVGAPSAAGVGRPAGRSQCGDGAPRRPQRGGGEGAGRVRCGARVGGAALRAHGRQSHVPGGDARGSSAKAAAATRPCRRTSIRPKPSASSWRGACPACPRT